MRARGSASEARQAWECLQGPDVHPALVLLTSQTFLRRIRPGHREAPLCSVSVNNVEEERPDSPAQASTTVGRFCPQGQGPQLGSGGNHLLPRHAVMRRKA